MNPDAERAAIRYAEQYSGPPTARQRDRILRLERALGRSLGPMPETNFEATGRVARLRDELGGASE